RAAAVQNCEGDGPQADDLPTRAGHGGGQRDVLGGGLIEDVHRVSRRLGRREAQHRLEVHRRARRAAGGGQDLGPDPRGGRRAPVVVRHVDRGGGGAGGDDAVGRDVLEVVVVDREAHTAVDRELPLELAVLDGAARPRVQGDGLLRGEGGAGGEQPAAAVDDE